MVKSCQNYLMGDCRSYGSIPSYAFDSIQNADATYLCLENTDGYMTFELSHVNNRNLWNSARDGIQRYEQEAEQKEKTN